MNILCINRKGGTGKTTLADEILFSLDRKDNLPGNLQDTFRTAFIDLDSQDSAIHKDTAEHADDADIVVIDTPGALTNETPFWISEADIIVIPTGASVRDMTPFLAALDAAREYGNEAKIIIVVNRFNHYRASSEFLEALKNYVEPNEIIVTLPQSEVFLRAAANDESVVTYAPKSKAALRTLEVINVIRAAAGLPPDPTDLESIKTYLDRQARLAIERRKKGSKEE